MDYMYSVEMQMHEQKRYDDLFAKAEAANLTKNEDKSYNALVEEHGLTAKFTSYFKDEFDQNQPICSYIMMQRLINKGLIKKVEKPYKISEPHVFEWV
jgi:DNA-directed RNA polymerase beta subunit